jgi:hypothetical protein
MSKLMKQYEIRVTKLEAEGMTRSDAQGIADVEFNTKYGFGWEFQ